MNHVINCILIFNFHGYLVYFFNLEVHFILFIWYMSAFHVWYQVVRFVSYSCITSYIWCVILIVVAIITIFNKFIVVVDLFVFCSLLSIDLCLVFIALVNNDIKDDIILIKVFFILVIIYLCCLIHNYIGVGWFHF